MTDNQKFILLQCGIIEEGSLVVGAMFHFKDLQDYVIMLGEPFEDNYIAISPSGTLTHSFHSKKNKIAIDTAFSLISKAVKFVNFK